MAEKLTDGGANTYSQKIKESCWNMIWASLCPLSKPTSDSFLKWHNCPLQCRGASVPPSVEVYLRGRVWACQRTLNFHGNIWIQILRESRPSEWVSWQASLETWLHLKDGGYNYCHHCLHQELQPRESGASSRLVSALNLALFYVRPVAFLTCFLTVKNYLFSLQRLPNWPW